MGKYSYVYRGEVAPEDKGALWVHHEVFNDVSSPLVAEVYNGGSWSTLAGGSILEAIAAEEKKKEEEKKEEERKEYQELLKEPLTFEAKANNTKIYFLAYNADVQTRTIEVSTDDGETWTEFTSKTYDEDNNTPIATLNMCQKVLVRGDNQDGMGYFDDYAGDPVSAGAFWVEGQAYVYGNIMSLLDSDSFSSLTSVPEYAFACQFYDYDDRWTNEGSLFSHPTKKLLLTATILAPYCYSDMFRGCTAITAAPELPATKLAGECYSSMFHGCTSLTVAPKLHATTLANNCYSNMFHDCTNLTIAPELPATTLARGCYTLMFQDCTSLTIAPELPATTLAERCYYQMFTNCSSLTTAPELPATTLASYCYSNMFKKCTSLAIAPELPATILAEHCYENMFEGCAYLSLVKCAFTTTPGDSYTSNWLANVFPVGVILKKGPWTTTGDSGIPSGWTARSY